MDSRPSDQAARDRFTGDWGTNLAVVANAGSGKTTAISERLAAMALSPAGAEMLARTAVVTYTNNAAGQIGQKARAALLRRMAGAGPAGADPLAALDRAFFGTIHSFCILLARRHGSTLGIHLNPVLIEEEDDVPWEEFMEQDPMQFESLRPSQVDAFLRHASLDDVFDLARELSPANAAGLAAGRVAEAPPAPPAGALESILGASARKGAASEALGRNKETARDWLRRFGAESGSLPIPRPEGSAGSIVELYRRFFAPLKEWLAAAGGVLAAELSVRYRAWRQDRGIQTYADQVGTALEVLSDSPMLERIRGEGWRVILDEAQDTDTDQFAVLVEIARPPGSVPRSWPGRGGAGPRPGHFCMVGDPQQGIYSDRADIRNFQAHVEAFARSDGGERLTFDVTFRAPRRVVRLLNDTLAGAFGTGHAFNYGLAPAEGAAEPFLQAEYEPLVPGPRNGEGGAWILPVALPEVKGTQVADTKVAAEARQVAHLLLSGGAASVGARNWGDICILAPRRAWLQVIRGELEAAGLKVALQMRRNRNGDNPAYAWMCGLLSVVCDPENTFEWVGVLREVFAVSDSMIAGALRGGSLDRWDEPGGYPPPIRGALEALGPFIARADREGDELGRFASDLSAACELPAKARLADPAGGLEDELARILNRAAELGAAGSGPREWLRELLGSIDGLRSSGRPAPDAVNLITSHSAKGLEWPVVIPVGLWRKIGRRDPRGLRLVPERAGVPRVVLDSDGVDQRGRDSIERAWLREQVRLLYVVLTRAKSALVVPWAGAQAVEKNSFAELWELDPSKLDELQPRRRPRPAAKPPRKARAPGRARAAAPRPAPALPERILPHELAREPDLARAARHESSLDVPPPAREGPDPLEYGIWWHETLEFLPWEGDAGAVSEHGGGPRGQGRRQGLRRARGREEWGSFLASEPWRLMRDARWTRLAEVGIFAPLGPGRWIDGVIDLVLHDAAAREVWIVDWKTNRIRRRRGRRGAPLQALGGLPGPARGLRGLRSRLLPGMPGAPLGLFDRRRGLDRGAGRGLTGRDSLAAGRLHSTARRADRTFPGPNLHGKSQEKAPAEDEQAQAPKALEVEPPQKAHMAEINPTRRIFRRVLV